MARGASVLDEGMVRAVSGVDKEGILTHQHVRLSGNVRGAVARRTANLVVVSAVPRVVAGHTERATACANSLEASRQ